jgi:hypothetical protein
MRAGTARRLQNGYAGYNKQDEYQRTLQAAFEAVRPAPNTILALKMLAGVLYL